MCAFVFLLTICFTNDQESAVKITKNDSRFTYSSFISDIYICLENLLKFVLQVLQNAIMYTRDVFAKGGKNLIKTKESGMREASEFLCKSVDQGFGLL